MLVRGVQFTLLLFQAANQLALVELGAGWVCEVRNPYSCATPGKQIAELDAGFVSEVRNSYSCATPGKQHSRIR